MNGESPLEIKLSIYHYFNKVQYKYKWLAFMFLVSKKNKMNSGSNFLNYAR